MGNAKGEDVKGLLAEAEGLVAASPGGDATPEQRAREKTRQVARDAVARARRDAEGAGSLPAAPRGPESEDAKRRRVAKAAVRRAKRHAEDEERQDEEKSDGDEEERLKKARWRFVCRAEPALVAAGNYADLRPYRPNFVEISAEEAAHETPEQFARRCKAQGFWRWWYRVSDDEEIFRCHAPDLTTARFLACVGALKALGAKDGKAGAK